ncbi:hypothetical protein ACFS4T_16670 [Pseudomonas lini]
MRISASFRSTGKVEAVEGGWRLTGTWHYLSGIDFANWALLCIEVDDGEQLFAAIPADTWEVLDNWQTLGMRGHRQSLDQLGRDNCTGPHDLC